MAFGDTGVKDSFGGEAGVIINETTWGVSNRATVSMYYSDTGGATSPGSDGVLVGNYWLTSFGPDLETFWTVTGLPSTPTNRRIEIWARMQSPDTADTGYVLRVLHNGANWVWLIRRFNAGVQVDLSTDTVIALATGWKLGLSISGYVLQAYYDSGSGWSALGSPVDDSASGDKIGGTGYLGVIIDSSEMVLDDFGGGTVTAGGGSFTPDAAALTLTGAAPVKGFGVVVPTTKKLGT